VDDLHGSGVLHETALALVSAPSFARHVRRVQAELRSRRDVLLSELAARCPQLHVRHVPRGGLHLWADLPAGSDDEQLAADALRAGVLVGAGTPYYPAEAVRPGLRLSFASATVDDLRDGVRRLASVLDQR
jgi:DNA-binding transcriptional MocR family regulator